MARDPHREQVGLPQQVRAELVAHAREAAPLECCGLLIGTRGRVTASARARNLDARPTRFLIDPRDHFTAMRTARAAGQRVIGAYHSHVSGDPAPSETDISEATGEVEFLYVIVSAASAEIGAYFLRRGRVEFVDLI